MYFNLGSKSVVFSCMYRASPKKTFSTTISGIKGSFFGDTLYIYNYLVLPDNTQGDQQPSDYIRLVIEKNLI